VAIRTLRVKSFSHEIRDGENQTVYISESHGNHPSSQGRAAAIHARKLFLVFNNFCIKFERPL